MGVKIETFFGPLARGANSTARDSVFVHADLAAEKEWSNSTSSRLPEAISSGVVCLLDTGADACRIDQAMAGALGLTPLPESSWVYSITPDGAVLRTAVYFVQVVFRDAPYVFAANFAASDLRIQNQRIILGMDFLRLFDFHLVKKRGFASLELVGE